MFLKLDWGIIWPIVNIVVFYLLLRKFLFGPVSEVMEKRKKMISSDLDDAAQTKAEAEEIKQEYEKNLAQAKDEACLLYTSPSPRDQRGSRMPSSA